jgi:hypothetical protein
MTYKQYLGRIEDHVGDLPLRRRGDKYLIPAFYDVNSRDIELVAANRFRLYLRVMTLADIYDGLGDHVTRSGPAGHHDTDRPHYYEWPAQGYPSGGDWTIWRTAIAQAFFDLSNHSRALPLALVHVQTRRIPGDSSPTLPLSTKRVEILQWAPSPTAQLRL